MDFFRRELVEMYQINTSAEEGIDSVFASRLFDNFVYFGLPMDKFILSPFDKTQCGCVLEHLQPYGFREITVGDGIVTYENCTNRFHKLVYLVFFNRKLLKEKVKHRLRNHKIILFIASWIYIVLRTAYWLVRDLYRKIKGGN